MFAIASRWSCNVQLFAISLHLRFQLVSCSLASSVIRLYRPSIAALLDLWLTFWTVAVGSIMKSRLLVKLLSFSTAKEAGSSCLRVILEMAFLIFVISLFVSTSDNRNENNSFRFLL